MQHGRWMKTLGRFPPAGASLLRGHWKDLAAPTAPSLEAMAFPLLELVTPCPSCSDLSLGAFQCGPQSQGRTPFFPLRRPERPVVVARSNWRRLGLLCSPKMMLSQYLGRAQSWENPAPSEQTQMGWTARSPATAGRAWKAAPGELSRSGRWIEIPRRFPPAAPLLLRDHRKDLAAPMVPLRFATAQAFPLWHFAIPCSGGSDWLGQGCPSLPTLILSHVRTRPAALQRPEPGVRAIWANCFRLGRLCSPTMRTPPALLPSPEPGVRVARANCLRLGQHCWPKLQTPPAPSPSPEPSARVAWANCLRLGQLCWPTMRTHPALLPSPAPSARAARANCLRLGQLCSPTMQTPPAPLPSLELSVKAAWANCLRLRQLCSPKMFLSQYIGTPRFWEKLALPAPTQMGLSTKRPTTAGQAWKSAPGHRLHPGRWVEILCRFLPAAPFLLGDYWKHLAAPKSPLRSATAQVFPLPHFVTLCPSRPGQSLEALQCGPTPEPIPSQGCAPLFPLRRFEWAARATRSNWLPLG